MPRRGRCHCGAILEFRSGPDGYKMRCAACGAVVRLRAAPAKRAGARHATPPRGAPASLPPPLTVPNPFEFGTGPHAAPGPGATPPPRGPFPGLLPGEVPLLELEPLASPPRKPVLGGWPLWTGIAAGLLLLAGALGWWFLVRP